jgi:hypothetical protein
VRPRGFVEGLRTRALSGENAGGSVCAADQVGAARARSSGMHSDILSGSAGLSGVTARPGDLSVYANLASRRFFGCAGLCRIGSPDCV